MPAGSAQLRGSPCLCGHKEPELCSLSDWMIFGGHCQPLTFCAAAAEPPRHRRSPPHVFVEGVECLGSDVATQVVLQRHALGRRIGSTAPALLFWLFGFCFWIYKIFERLMCSCAVGLKLV